MEVLLPEIVSKELFLQGFFEEGLTSALLFYLKPGAVFIDIGAHYGYFSLLAAAVVEKRGRVFSFEPTPEVFQTLEKNTANLHQISCWQKAVWSEEGELSFRNYGEKYSAFNSFFTARLDEECLKKTSFTEVRVQVETLDAFVRREKIAPDFIKIDAENSESRILSGMKETILRFQPIITLETGDCGGKEKKDRETIQELVNLGYEVLEYRDGKFEPHLLKEKYDYDNLLFLPSRKADKDLFRVTRIKELLRKSKPVILEAGAHYGQHSVQFLNLCQDVILYAFEPDPRCIKQFRLRISDPRCFLVEAAVSCQDGEAELHLSQGCPPWDSRALSSAWDQSSSIQKTVSRSSQYPWLTFGKKVKVRTVSLDSWCSKQEVSDIDLLWIDVQGSEKKLLEGAKKTLRTTNYIYIEYGETSVYPEAMTRAQTIEMLRDFGFVLLEDYSDSSERGNLLFKNSGYRVAFQSEA